ISNRHEPDYADSVSVDLRLTGRGRIYYSPVLDRGSGNPVIDCRSLRVGKHRKCDRHRPPPLQTAKNPGGPTSCVARRSIVSRGAFVRGSSRDRRRRWIASTYLRYVRKTRRNVSPHTVRTDPIVSKRVARVLKIGGFRVGVH